MITIYGKPNCPFCVKAKTLASMLDLDFTYVDLTTDEEVLGKIKADGFRSVPAIYEDGVKIGGFTEFEQYVKGESL